MNYNPEQLTAIQSTEPYILVNSGPGTGKTSVLVGAATEYIKNNPDKKVSLITFTNKAADEMTSRMGLLPQIDYIGTIHGFAKKHLYNLAAEQGFRVRILQDDQVKQIIYQVVCSIDYIKRSDREYFAEEGFNFIMNRSNFFKEFKGYRVDHTLFDIDEQYQSFKIENGLYDRLDSPRYLLDKLIQYEQTIQCDKIFIDEAQDLDPIQYDLLKYFIGDKFAIGDPRQAIYQFRGASEKIFKQFIEDGYTEYTLTRNYRSYQEIIDFAGASLIADRGYGGKIYYDETIFKHNPMILCRTNKEVNTIKHKLYYPNVSTIHAAKGLEYDYVVVINFEIKEPEDNNVMFVGLTRAKNGIALLDFEDVFKNLVNRKIDY